MRAHIVSVKFLSSRYTVLWLNVSQSAHIFILKL